MREGGAVMLAKPVTSRPKLVVPPRNPSEAFIRGGLNSATPTPMSFVSSFFADQDPDADCVSFGAPPFDESLEPSSFSPLGREAGFFYNLLNKGSVWDMPVHSKLDEKLEENESHGVQLHPKSNVTARYRAMMPSKLPISCSSPHLTIPPGISPTSFLESPVLFSMGQADPSPTTGSFSTCADTYERELPTNTSTGEAAESNLEKSDSFMFRRYLPVANNNMGSFGVHFKPAASTHPDGCVHGSELSCSTEMPAVSDSTPWQASDLSSGGLEQPDPTMMPLVAKPFERAPPYYASAGVAHNPSFRASADGYNWKKYGQKQLKNSENPRSYYKCTYPNCPVKKQVERSLEGEITEIMYKGSHNHPKPQGSRRGARNSASIVVNSDKRAHYDCATLDLNAVRKMEVSSGDLSSSPFAHSLGGLPETPELSFNSHTIGEVEDGEACRVEDDGEEELDSKRRRIENENENYPSGPIRTVREPRVVVQTVSQVDILDDGYRWRKYGQKVVKGHYYPRNYYKCTNIGCGVRKHVERSSSDPKSVITTYEGKHNHSVPPARGSGREPCGSSIESAATYSAYSSREGSAGFAHAV